MSAGLRLPTRLPVQWLESMGVDYFLIMTRIRMVFLVGQSFGCLFCEFVC